MTTPSSNLAPLTWQIVESQTGWTAARAAWDGIAARGAAIGLFQSYDWLDTWWRNAPGDVALCVLIGADTQGPAAILPLVLHRHRFVRRLGWMAEAVSDYCDLLAAPGLDPAAFAAGLGDALRRTGADLVQLDQMPPEGPGARLLGSVLRQGPSTAIAPYIDLGGRDFAAVEEGFSAGLRQDLRRKAKRLGERAAWRYVEAETPAQRQAAIEFVLAQKAHQLAGDAAALARHQAGFAPFARDVFARARVGPAQTQVATIDAGGTIIAAHLGFVDAQRFYYYVPTYDPAHLEFSPGHLLLFELIRQGCETRVPIFDLLRGDYAYKWRLTEKAVRLRRFETAFTLMGSCYLLLRNLRGPR